ncbi:hypothetical protein AGMMS49965_08040 [Bacteroidia bacterium]|nr:hypothetical protein AGMMS49965_08040 [Bacteroidia bacterium]
MKTMTDFENAVNDLFLKKRGVAVKSLDYREMPNTLEADAIVDKFLSMPLP